MNPSESYVDVEGGVFYLEEYCIDLFTIRKYWDSIPKNKNGMITSQQFKAFIINTFGLKTQIEKEKNKEYEAMIKNWISYQEFTPIMVHHFCNQMPTTKVRSPTMQRFIENEI